MKLKILEFPDSRLRTVAKPVENVDDTILQITDDMLETMYAASGIGLAATQVNIHKRIIVADITEDHSEPLVFINPEITILEDKLQVLQEGCLSVPGFYEDVERAEHILVKALDKNGNEFDMELHGLLSTCLQHETDHLNGKLFVDYISPLKRQRIRKKLEKQHRLQAKTEQTPQKNQLSI